MKWNWHVMNFATAADMLPVGSISKKIVSRKSHKIWKMTALPYISKYSYISRWLGSYIYYHLPPPWWIAKRNIKIMGVLVVICLPLLAKKSLCRGKGSQGLSIGYAVSCKNYTTDILSLRHSMLLLLLLFLRPCRRRIFCSSIIWM